VVDPPRCSLVQEIQKAQHEIDSGESLSADELREKYLQE
jgi:hypothetical protein